MFSEKKAASVFFLVTVLLLVVSIVVHCLLFAGFNTRDRIPLLWDILQYGIVIGFIPAAIDLVFGKLGTTPSPRYVWGSTEYLGREGSIWVAVFIVAVLIFFLYALMSPIYWYVEQLHQWNPYISDGQYFAYYKQRGFQVRSLTAEEYRVMSLYYARAGSSHWPLCHSIAVAVLCGAWDE